MLYLIRTMQADEIVRRIIEGKFVAGERVLAAALEKRKRPVGLQRVEAWNQDAG